MVRMNWESKKGAIASSGVILLLFTGNEDCLHVNVFVPRKHPKEGENLNVIVHIHGGALNFGYGHFYGPKFLMDQDIVYVNFNYRLGPLGNR